MVEINARLEPDVPKEIITTAEQRSRRNERQHNDQVAE